jgi:hypothetical protein
MIYIDINDVSRIASFLFFSDLLSFWEIIRHSLRLSLNKNNL